MKKQISNLGKALNKAEQKQINGGDKCLGMPGPSCYGMPGMNCGSCEDYNALPPKYQTCVMVYVGCFSV